MKIEKRFSWNEVRRLNRLGEEARMNWVMFTKRTDDPKLSYLEAVLDDMGIPHRRNGQSWHAPILEVPEEHLDAAWEMLKPIDDIDDDDPRFME